MKRINKFIGALCVMSIAFSYVPKITEAAELSVAYSNAFTEDGVVTSGSEGFTYSSGRLEVENGILKMTQAGEDVVVNERNQKGIFLDFDVETISSGTLVWEIDYYVPMHGAAFTNGFFFMYDANGREAVKLLKASDGANSWYVNRYLRVDGSTDPNVNDHKLTCLNNVTFSGADVWGIKIEVDLDRRVYRVYQAKTKTDGEWVYNQLQRKNYEGKTETEFPFTNVDASNITSVRWAVHNNELNATDVKGAAFDNIKIYKKFTATQAQTSYNMLPGETKQAGINFSPAGDRPVGMIWESTDTTVATVDENGAITAHREGTSDITVRHDFYTQINYTYQVNVVEGSTGLTVDKTKSTICLGDTVTLAISPVPAKTAYKDLVWASSDERVATVVNGVVTGIEKGSATITATAVGKNGAEIKATATVTVVKPITAISLNAPQTSLTVGEKVSFSAIVEPSDASEVEKKWRSGNHYVASVDQNGNVTAVGEGSTDIYVSASGYTASCAVTVSGKGGPSSKTPSRVSFYIPTGYSFTDIADMEWARAAVYAAADEGYMIPDSETVFGAKRNIKRDEFVSVIIKALDLMRKTGNTEQLKAFTDVAEDAPYREEIMKALELGIIQGVSETEFAPDADITRQDMSVVVVNAFKVASVKTEEGRLDFADKDSIAEYAQTAVRILSKMGIIIGKNDNCFDPLANTTRAEVAVILDRIQAVR